MKQYLCHGVGGWKQWMNLIEDSYRNIVRMCGYVKKHGVIGILNTDWGDFGHVNHPEYSVSGMIYGAAFSWNAKMVPFEEINGQIARVEYHDASGELVNFLAKIPGDSLMTWWHAVMYYEIKALGGPGEELPDFSKLSGDARVQEANARLQEVRRQIWRTAVCMDSRERTVLWSYDITIDGIVIWNEIGRVVAQEEKDSALAERLERWFMAYKSLWRETSRERDLAYISEIVFWYADLLRGRERKRRRDELC